MAKLDQDTINAIAYAVKEAFKESSRTMSRAEATTRRAAPRATQQKSVDSINFKNLGQSQLRLLKATDDLVSLTKQQIKNTKKGQDAQNEYNDAVKSAAASINSASKEYESMIHKSLGQQIVMFTQLSKDTGGLSSKLAQSQVASSHFASALIGSYGEIESGSSRYAVMIEDLKNSTSNLDKKYLESANIIDSVTGEFAKNLDPSHFAELRSQLGHQQAIIIENLEKVGIQNLDTIVSDRTKLEGRLKAVASEGELSGDEFKKTLLVIAKQLKESGHDMAQNLSDASKINYADLADTINQVSSSISKTNESLGKIAKQSNTLAGSWIKSLTSMAGVTALYNDKILKTLVDSTFIISQLGKLKEGVKDVYKQVIDFNIAQIPASFMQVQVASVKLGMSFAETVQFLQENKRLLAIYGAKDGNELINTLKPTFASFGYNAKQAAELIGPSIDSAIASGINIRGGDSLNKFIDSSMESFKQISGIVNITGKEYMRLYSDLIKSEDVQSRIMGMDKERGQAYAQDINALRNHYVQLGLSTDQAQALVKAQESQKRQKVTERFEEGAKAALLARQVGMSEEEANRIFGLAAKGRLSKPEKEEQTGLLRKLGEREAQMQEQAGEAGLQTSIVAQTLSESLLIGKQRELTEATAPMVLAERSQAAMDDASARIAGALGVGSKSVADFGNVVNSITSFLQNSLSVVAASAALSLVGLTVQSRLAASALGLISGRGILGGLAGKAAGAIPAAGAAVGAAASAATPVAGKVASTVAGAATTAASTVAGAPTPTVGAPAAAPAPAAAGSKMAKIGGMARAGAGLAKAGLGILGGPLGIGLMAAGALKSYSDSLEEKGTSIGSNIYDLFNKKSSILEPTPLPKVPTPTEPVAKPSVEVQPPPTVAAAAAATKTPIAAVTPPVVAAPVEPTMATAIKPPLTPIVPPSIQQRDLPDAYLSEAAVNTAASKAKEIETTTEKILSVSDITVHQDLMNIYGKMIESVELLQKIYDDKTPTEIVTPGIQIPTASYATTKR